MLRRKDWITDDRPTVQAIAGKPAPKTWQQWLDVHYNVKEHWFMSIVDFLLGNQDWAGAYLLIRTYIGVVRQTEESSSYINAKIKQKPWLETPHVRCLRYWFWSLCEKHNFAEIEVEDESEFGLDRRRDEETEQEQKYPFVGGKPNRRHTESSEFFKQVAQERSHYKRKGSLNPQGKEKE